MSESFNPYRDWLNIPANELPADHYQLLGIAPFEADEEKIAQAADARMKMLRAFQAGKHARESQQLLNEVAAARICLLNAERRRRYDKDLRERRRALDLPPLPEPFRPFPQSSSGQHDAPAAEPHPDESGRMLPAPNTSTRRSLPIEWWWIISIIGILAVLVLALSLLWNSFS